MAVRYKPRSVKQAKEAVEQALLYYDRGVFLVNKPTDMTCQMSYSTSAKYEKFNVLCKGIQLKLGMRHPPCSVHRLDKDTTGALLLARDSRWASKLSEQFREKEIKKTYLALVHGGEERFPTTSGIIEARLTKEIEGGRVYLDREGTQTKTEWEVLGSSPRVPLTLLRLNLITGHKHQLRVHLAKCLDAPVVGDNLYANKHFRKEITSEFEIPKKLMFLHASEISFKRWNKTHPRTPFELKFRVPVPMKFQVLCRDAKIPVERDWLSKGEMWINGRPWRNPNHLVSASEEYWVSPALGLDMPQKDSDLASDI